ncbi:MAG: hypothetical protein MAG795_00192 [Candidatus Woesearchaeota archaeon]|nr:hypothetical protein [Candidatus Woesearchaeota archaeon]
MGEYEELDERIGKLEAELEQYNSRPKKVSLVVWSGEYDRVLPAFVIANGAKAMGMDVDMYFTFWGLKALQKEDHRPEGTNLLNKPLHYMLPGGPKGAKLSSLHMYGIGKGMIKKLMADQGISDLEEQIDLAYEQGVNIQACTLAMGIFGMDKSDFSDVVGSYVGVATYLMNAAESDITLFI